jgi:hypothetical protein
MAKDKKGHGKGMPAEDASSKPVIWACSACGQENEAAEEVCCACEEPRPSSTSGNTIVKGVCQHQPGALSPHLVT